MLTITAFQVAQRFVGMKEVAGNLKDHPLILAMLQLDGSWPQHDEVPWCSAFVNFIAWLLNLPRSKSLAARSWLEVGRPIELEDATVGFDVVVLSRDGGGHVGFYAGVGWKPYDVVNQGANPRFSHGDPVKQVYLLAGNQGDAVNISSFPAERVLGVRRLFE